MKGYSQSFQYSPAVCPHRLHTVQKLDGLGKGTSLVAVRFEVGAKSNRIQSPNKLASGNIEISIYASPTYKSPTSQKSKQHLPVCAAVCS